MTKLNRALVASVLLMSASSAFASSVPSIDSACVTFPEAGIARISGIVTDADGDAVAVTPLVIGSCLNGSQNVSGTSYVCDVPDSTKGYTVTLVASDAAGNYSAPVDVLVETGCKFY